VAELSVAATVPPCPVAVINASPAPLTGNASTDAVHKMSTTLPPASLLAVNTSTRIWLTRNDVTALYTVLGVGARP
jgi:hypothetical protein